jgi:aldehyde dehydrogenase (NAD+)
MAPALAVGNAVIPKPASLTPITGGLLHAKIYEEAGLPPGVLSVVVGASGEIGDAFVTHPVPRLITFTGSTAISRHIGALAGQHLKRSALELGGNAPLMILDDADLDVAVNAAVFGKFLNAGPIWMAINRILVDRRLHDEFLDRFAKRVAALTCGDPSEVICVEEHEAMVNPLGTKGLGDIGLVGVASGGPPGLFWRSKSS